MPGTENSVNNNIERATQRLPIHEKVDTVLQPIKRSSIACFGDKVGRIPLVGTAVGAVRLVASLAVFIFAGLAGILADVCGCKDFRDKCAFAATRACDEAQRGMGEIVFPVLLYMHIEQHREEKEKKGVISTLGGAYGQYMYQHPSGEICYTRNRFEGPVLWTLLNRGVAGGIIDTREQIAQQPNNEEG